MKSESLHDYCQGFYDCLVKMRKLEFFDFDPSKMICADFVMNSHGTERERTIGMIGGKQIKVNKKSPVYTNSYLVFAAMKRGLGLKAIMYTHDPVFDAHG